MTNKGYSAEWLDALKAKNNIVDVISKYITLEKKGRNFWGRCPFHHEKTPSFAVNDIDQFYHCFGCGEGGDVIKFVTKIESVDFSEAVKILAQNCGMEIPEFKYDEKTALNKKQKEKSLEILEKTKEFYKKNLYLTTSKIAQDYIKKRSLTKRELDDFEIGYSTDWTSLVSYLKSQGYSIEELMLAGVVDKKEDAKPYDFFGGRLMFPIINIYGECIGFSGRILVQSDFAKYKNSPQNLVFDKSKIVYGINLLKKLKQTEPFENIIIVEGQMDVIAMHKGGFKNSVACLGTALTSYHAKELRRISDNIILCLDGDSAGQKATARSLDILKEAGLNVLVATLPKGKDPDETLKEYGAEFLRKTLQSAIPPTDFLLNCAKIKYDLNKPYEKSKYVKEALDIIQNLSSNAEKEAYLALVRDQTNVPIDILRRDISGDQTNNMIVEESGDSVLLNRENGNIKAVDCALANIIAKKSYVLKTINLSHYLINPTQIKIYNEIINKDYDFTVGNLYGLLDDEETKSLDKLVGFQFIGDDELDEKYYRECLWQLVDYNLKQEQQKLMNDFKSEQDIDARKQIMIKLNEISKRIKSKNLEEL